MVIFIVIFPWTEIVQYNEETLIGKVHSCSSSINILKYNVLIDT